MDGAQRQEAADGQDGGDGDVGGQQAHRAQAAGVLQDGQGGGQPEPGADADAGVQGGADDGGQVELLRQDQGAAHPAERGGLEHDDVGGLQPPHGEGVGGQVHGLVGGDGHVDATAQDGEIGHARAGLLGVLQAAGGPVHEGQGVQGGLQVPGAAEVDAHAPERPQGGAHGAQAPQVGVEGSRGGGDPDLGGGGPGLGDEGVRLVGVDLGDDDVDGDLLAPHGQTRQAHGGLLDPGGEPRGAGGGGVVPEGGDLAPAGGAVEEDAVAVGQAVQAGAHGQLPDDGAVDARQQAGAVAGAQNRQVELAAGARLARHPDGRTPHASRIVGRGPLPRDRPVSTPGSPP